MPPGWLMNWVLKRKKRKQTERELRLDIIGRKLEEKGIDISTLEDVEVVSYGDAEHWEIRFTIGN